MVVGSKILEENPDIDIRQFKALINSKQYLKQIEQRKEVTIQFAGNWFQRNIPFMAPRRSRDYLSGGGVLSVPHNSIHHNTKQIKSKIQDKKIEQPKQIIPTKYEQDVKDAKYLKCLSTSKTEEAHEENNIYHHNNIPTTQKQDNKASITSHEFN